MDKYVPAAKDPEPESQLTQPVRRLVIRPQGAVWSLEDEHREMGGVFVSLSAALAFARGEQLHGASSIRIVIAGEERRDRRLHAA